MSTFNLANYINSDTSNVLYSEVREDNPNFVIECVNFIDQLNKEYYKLNREFYISLYEAGNNEYIIENTFNNFFNSIEKIISKLLKFIKTIFEKFVVLLNKLAGSDNYIKKNKDKLNKFNQDCEFYIDGFTFTFNKDIPLINAQKEFDNELIDLVNSGKDIKKANELFINKLNEGYFDKFRAIVIGKKGQTILSEDYNDELFKLFRNNDNEKSNIKIDKSKVDKSLDRFINYKTIRDSIEDLKKDIEIQYTKIQNEFKNEFNDRKKLEILNKLKKNTETPALQLEDISKDFDIFLKNKIDQIQSMSRIHSLVFASKIQAVKDCVKQDKQILYGALSKVANIHESVIEINEEDILNENRYYTTYYGVDPTYAAIVFTTPYKGAMSEYYKGNYELYKQYYERLLSRCNSVGPVDSLRRQVITNIQTIDYQIRKLEKAKKQEKGIYYKRYLAGMTPEKLKSFKSWFRTNYLKRVEQKLQKIITPKKTFNESNEILNEDIDLIIEINSLIFYEAELLDKDVILTEAALGSFKTFFKKYDELTQEQLSKLQETGQFERLRPYIIKQIDRCRTIEELENLRTEATIGVSQLNNMKSIIEQSMRVRSAGKKTKQYHTNLQPRRIQMQIDWINSVYKVAINNKIKRIKALTESSLYNSEVKFEEYTTESVDYLSSQANLQMEQIMTDYIYKESVILKENKSPLEILIIQEALIKNIKEWWLKLMQAIARMWAKFLEFIKFHFNKEATYLTKYKDIIKNKPCKDNYKMFEYWKQENKLLGESIPTWNFSTLKPYLGNDEDFIDKYFKEYKHEKLDYKEYAKEIFRGGSEAKEIKASNIPLNQMYDFCLNYEKLSKKLEDDMKELDRCSSETIKLIEETNRNKSPETTPNAQNESVYSYILKSYITEEVVTKPQILKQDNSKEGEANKSAKADNGAEKMSNIKKDENYDEKEDIKNNTSSSDDIQLAKRYLTISYGFLQVKMQILQETFKAYIYVLRNHVVSYLGKEKEDNETVSGTDKKKEEASTNTSKKSISSMTDDIIKEKNKK